MSLSKYEIYVKALLDGYRELQEKRYYGLWHVSDVLADFEEAIGLAELTERQAQVISLYFEKHMHQDEVASTLGIARQTVTEHLRTAIKKIANIYEQWEALEYVDEII